MGRVWVYAEVFDNGVDPAALEILTRARELDPDVEAIVLSPGASDAAEKLGEFGATRVYAGDDAVYADYVAEPAAHALHQLVAEHHPELILFSTSYDSRDVAGRLSALTGATLMSNATDIIGLDRARTAVFGGTTVVDVALRGELKLVLVRPKSFEAKPSGGSHTVIPVDVAIPEEIRRARRVERHEEQAAGPKLEDARVVISGGRGLQSPENFKLLDELAAAIGGAAVGGTRAVVDAGWVPYSYQIGQTGTTVKPEVYMAFGISGATQHVVGMKGAKRIVAVNKDEDAPIFSIADLGVIADALKLLPELIDEIRSRKE